MSAKLLIKDLIDRLPSNSLLTPLYFLERGSFSHRRVQCRCICGKEIAVFSCNLPRGHTVSCGSSSCLVSTLKGIPTKYSVVNHKLRAVWGAMMQRCYNEKYHQYNTYGGRGVKVCEKWHTYQPFLDWALLNGWEKGLHMDKDIKGNGLLYSPETCCFVTRIINGNNTRTNRYIEYQGKTISVADACRLTNSDHPLTCSRIGRGYTFEQAIANPFIKHPYKKNRIKRKEDF